MPKAHEPQFREGQCLYLKDPFMVPLGDKPLSPVIEVPAGTAVKAVGKHKFATESYYFHFAKDYHLVVIDIGSAVLRVWIEERLLSTE